MRALGRLAGVLLTGLTALLLLPGPAAAASPVVELVDRMVPGHARLDAARDALARARATAGDASPAARAAAGAYAAESERHAARLARVASRTADERALRDAMEGSSRALAADMRAFSAGTIGAAELDRRVEATRARAGARIAELVPAIAAAGGLDGTVDGRGLASAMAPVILLVAGVVGLAALARRRTGARRSRAP